MRGKRNHHERAHFFKRMWDGINLVWNSIYSLTRGNKVLEKGQHSPSMILTFRQIWLIWNLKTWICYIVYIFFLINWRYWVGEKKKKSTIYCYDSCNYYQIMLLSLITLTLIKEGVASLDPSPASHHMHLFLPYHLSILLVGAVRFNSCLLWDVLLN